MIIRFFERRQGLWAFLALCVAIIGTFIISLNNVISEDKSLSPQINKNEPIVPTIGINEASSSQENTKDFLEIANTSKIKTKEVILKTKTSSIPSIKKELIKNGLCKEPLTGQSSVECLFKEG